MIKEVVGSVMAVSVAVLLLVLIIPTLNTAKIAVFETVNTTNPTNEQLVNLGDSVFIGIIILIVVVTGLTVLAYASRRDPFASMGGG
jgi:hypothetical protein